MWRALKISGGLRCRFLEHSYVRTLLYNVLVSELERTEMPTDAVQPSQRLPSSASIVVHSTCSDNDYQPVNEISEEARSLILRWENEKAMAATSQKNPYIRTRHASMQIYGSDLLQPPQRYRRVSRRAQLG